MRNTATNHTVDVIESDGRHFTYEAGQGHDAAHQWDLAGQTVTEWFDLSASRIYA